MLDKFFTWGYIKFVLMPEVRRSGINPDDGFELEVEFLPDENFIAEIEAREATKH